MSVHAVQKFAEYIPSHLATSLVASIKTLSLSPTRLPLHVVPFISQSLRKLRLTFSYHGEPSEQSACVQSMLAAVRAAATLPNSSLEELKLSSHTSDTDLCVAISECLDKHRATISNLNLDLPIDDQVWSSVCSLPCLRAVAVSPFNSSEFGKSARIITMIQELVKAQPLLERFRVSLPALSFAAQEDPDLGRSVIRQLLGLHSLRSVDISASAPILLAEDDVREMGASWPQIRTVRLQPPIVWFAPGLMAETNLSVLPSFLRHLPYLEELDLPWRCDSLSPAEQPNPKPLLRVLEVSGSPAPSLETEQVASYLASVLPPTARVKHDGIMFGGEGKAIWKEIIRRFEGIRNARNQDPTNVPAI
ncbi:hypothetical protein FS837_001733 [Tulasnella sp. UAMH 9824]|nr:hypothetical protein FS837_001733 [Tulasnella sp. UAMH 9824]